MLPRRKNLDFVNDIPGVNNVHIQLSLKDNNSKRKYYDTKTDPLYNAKSLGHDVFNSDITKQRNDFELFDNHNLPNDTKNNFNKGIYSNASGYVESNRLEDRFGGFSSGYNKINYNTNNDRVS